MKDFSKENVKDIIEAAMQEYGVEALYAISPSGLLLDIQDGFEFFTDSNNTEFCDKLAEDLSIIDDGIWTCVVPLTARSKERMKSMLHPVFIRGEYAGDIEYKRFFQRKCKNCH